MRPRATHPTQSRQKGSKLIASNVACYRYFVLFGSLDVYRLGKKIGPGLAPSR